MKKHAGCGWSADTRTFDTCWPFASATTSLPRYGQSSVVAPAGGPGAGSPVPAAVDAEGGLGVAVPVTMVALQPASRATAGARSTSRRIARTVNHEACVKTAG